MKKYIFSDRILKSFLTTLVDNGLSTVSVKNYSSDISHFSGWLILRVRSFGSFVESFSEAIPFIQKNMGLSYKTFLVQNAIPVQTVNRRLSSLRHLSRFLASSQILDFDFMDGIGNVVNESQYLSSLESLVKDFESHLLQEKASPNTLKCYLSDIKHFLAWLEAKNTKGQSTLTANH